MFEQALAQVLRAVGQCIDWFSLILVQMGAWVYVWGMLIAMLVFRFIILPIVQGEPIRRGDTYPTGTIKENQDNSAQLNLKDHNSEDRHLV